jgi:hypothetical protein
MVGGKQQDVRAQTVNFTGAAGDGKPDRLAWTSDGKLLTVSTSNGLVFTYLMALPVLSAAHQQRLVYLSSLRELTVTSALNMVGTSLTVNPGILYFVFGDWQRVHSSVYIMWHGSCCFCHGLCWQYPFLVIVGSVCVCVCA